MSSTVGVKLCPYPQTAVLAAPEPTAAPAPALDLDREKLLLAHLPQVRLIAERVHKRMRFATDLDDLMAYGMIGLLKAIERFDRSRGTLLKTYAEHRIRGAILDGLRSMDWLSRSARQKKRLWQQHSSGPDLPGEKPSDPDVPPVSYAAAELIYVGTNLEDFEKLSERMGLRNTLIGCTDNPEIAYQRKENRQRIAQALALLPWKHRRVVYLYHYSELTMKQISQLLHVHESRVSQIHTVALNRLRSILLDGAEAAKTAPERTGAKTAQPVPRRSSKCRTTAFKSSSVSTPIVSSAVSIT